MSRSESQSEFPSPPNSSEGRTRRKKLTKEKQARDFPSFRKQDAHLAASSPSHRSLSNRAMALNRLGLTERDIENVASITRQVREATGSVQDAVDIIATDDNEDSIRFTAKWNSISAKDRKDLHLEDVIIAAGMTTRRFKELLAGASSDDHLFRALVGKTKVLKSVMKAATDELPIMATLGNAQVEVGRTNGDMKAAELFYKITGDIKTSGGINVNSNNQTATINAPVDRVPLQSMDSWLLEIDEIRKPKQLNAPVTPIIPVEIPDGAPEIEYMPLGDE